MTKTKMVETLKQKEAKLWLDLRQYEWANAPDDGDREKELIWERTDTIYLCKLFAWNAVHEVLEEFGIKHEHNDKALEYSSDLFTRRQAARGIYY